MVAITFYDVILQVQIKGGLRWITKLKKQLGR